MTTAVPGGEAPSATAIGQCSRADCPVSAGGQKCAQGFDPLLDCPTFEPAVTDPTTPLGEGATDTTLAGDIEPEGDLQATPEPSQAWQHGRTLLTGSDSLTVLEPLDELDDDAAYKLMRRAGARVIVLAGPVRSGKTTLIAGLWERFKRFEIDHYLFAGSNSLNALERRCHLANLESGRTIPDTGRTRRAAPPYLHLAARDTQMERPVVQLLIADISGEAFRGLITDSDPAEAGAALRHADHLVILLDGEVLSGQHWRTALLGVRSLLEVIRRDSYLRDGASVEIVMTKQDALTLTPQRAEELAAAEERWHALASGHAVCVVRTAARPTPQSDVPEGQGLSELANIWLGAPIQSAPPGPVSYRAAGRLPSGGRSSMRFRAHPGLLRLPVLPAAPSRSSHE